MRSPVYVTGYGIITSIGNNAEENLNALLNNRHGFGRFEILETVHRDSIRGCEIKLSDDKLQQLANVPVGSAYTRASSLGVIAATEAVNMAQLSKQDLQQAALISATTTGGVREFEKYYFDLQDHSKHGTFEQFGVTANPGEHAERLADHFGIKNYVSTISTACSSSANAIMSGAQLIANGITEVAICGGAEVLSKFTINGFNSLMILDKEHCRPFDQTRAGLNLGEGSAYVVLESEERIKKSRKTPLAVLRGFGNANDAFHQTASSPNGDGAFRAMQMALQTGGVSPQEIQYINAHGTGTENNDITEGLAIERLFGPTVPPFSSTKPFVGHTLASAGAIEAIFSIFSLQHGIIFSNLNFKQAMEGINVTPATHLKKGESITNVLSNSFGFGGNTSSLLLSKV